MWLDDTQRKPTPSNELPLESVATAENCFVAPGGMGVASCMVTVTAAYTCATDTVISSLEVPAVAVMIA